MGGIKESHILASSRRSEKNSNVKKLSGRRHPGQNKFSCEVFQIEKTEMHQTKDIHGEIF
jgi:hypothetical protein